MLKSDKLKRFKVHLFLLLCERLRWSFWDFFDHFCFMWINLLWTCSTEDKHFCDLAFCSRYYWELTVQSLVNVTVECETLRCWLLTSMETVLLLIEGYVCLTHAVWSFKSKKWLYWYWNFCPLQVTTVKLCIIMMKNIYYCILLLVQHLTVSVLIW